MIRDSHKIKSSHREQIKRQIKSEEERNDLLHEKTYVLCTSLSVAAKTKVKIRIKS